MSSVPTKETVQGIIDYYTQQNGPRRSWNEMGPVCGFSDGKSLKRYFERWIPFYKLQEPPREYERMRPQDRLLLRIQHKIQQSEPVKQLDDVVEPPVLPEELPSADELRERRRVQFRRKAAAERARALIEVPVKIKGPIGILHFGDPHLDDDGTNWDLIERDISIINRTDGMLGANVGDTTNNWVGRLAKLYGDQTIKAAEAWVLAEWFIASVPWLYLIAGNHDMWSGSGDPIRWMKKQSATGYQESEVRLQLNFPNGTKIRVNVRHDFAGSSQWNPAHGPMKAAEMGTRDHIMISGHKHISGYGLVKDPQEGITCHCIQVASYKVYDRYAKEKNFRDQFISPSVVTVIDPDCKNEAGLVTVFHDAEAGADFLSFKRRKGK